MQTIRQVLCDAYTEQRVEQWRAAPETDPALQSVFEQFRDRVYAQYASDGVSRQDVPILLPPDEPRGNWRR